MSSDASLNFFQVNGVNFVNSGLYDEGGTIIGNSIKIGSLVATLTINIIPTHPSATFTINGNAGTSGVNTIINSYTGDVVINVTAEDGTPQQYLVYIDKPDPSNTNAVFYLNNTPINNGKTHEVGSLTIPSFLITLSDPGASITVNGIIVISGVSTLLSDLDTGENQVTVIIVSANGLNSTTTNFNFLKYSSSDSSIDNIQTIAGGKAIYSITPLGTGTTTTPIRVYPSDPDAIVMINGITGTYGTDTIISDLVSGINRVYIKIISSDGTSIYEVLIYFNVNNNELLQILRMNSEIILPGETGYVINGTFRVVVTATILNNATYTVSGDTDLHTGNNTVTVTVTAEDGVTTKDYLFTVYVNDPSDTSLTLLEANGINVADGTVINVGSNTNYVSIKVVTQSPLATFSVNGNSGTSGESIIIDGLIPDWNTIFIHVIAEDGINYQDYLVIVNLCNSFDTSLSRVQLNGINVPVENSLSFGPETTLVVVNAVTFDPSATFTINGLTGNSEIGTTVYLTQPSNLIKIRVLAGNGTNFEEYNIYANVTNSSTTTLSTLKMNDVDILPGDTAYVSNGTTSVLVTATTMDNATYTVRGNVELITGNNTVTVTVTAEDGVTTQDYLFTVYVNASSDTSLSSIQVNGNDVIDGFVSISSTTSVDVTATTTNNAIYTVIDNNLQEGNNTVIVRVTAEDGTTTEDYTITVYVKSSNTSLSVFKINGIDVDDQSVINVNSTTTVANVVALSDYNITYSVGGNTDLTEGENVIDVCVVAENDITQRVYIIYIYVISASDTSLSILQANGIDVLTDPLINVSGDTKTININVIPTNPSATYDILGNINFSIGDNTIIVRVTAEDGTTIQDYSFIIHVIEQVLNEVAQPLLFLNPH